MEITLVKPKTKSTSNGKQSDKPQPFYVDQAGLDRELRDQSRITRRIETARATYEAVTGDRISTIEQLQAMIAGPGDYFINKKAKEVEQRREKLAEVFGDGLDIRSFIKSSLPERFNEITNACRLCENVKWKFYRIADDGKLELTQAFHDRLNDQVYFYATTPNQIKRLDFARKMVRMLNFEMRELLQDQARENGTEHAVEYDLRMSRFIAGLPACCRIVYDPETDSRKIAVNEQFVVNGFNQWVPNVIKPKQRPEYTRRVRVCVYPGGSLAHKYSTFEHPRWPVDPTRVAKTVVLPTWFEIRAGKLYNTGVMAPRLPDAPLLTQLTETPKDIASKPYLNVV